MTASTPLKVTQEVTPRGRTVLSLFMSPSKAVAAQLHHVTADRSIVSFLTTGLPADEVSARHIVLVGALPVVCLFATHMTPVLW